MSQIKRGFYSHYGSVAYWREGREVVARFRGEYSDCVQRFPNLTAFKRAARKQFRDGTATETTQERMRFWELVNLN